MLYDAKNHNNKELVALFHNILFLINLHCILVYQWLRLNSNYTKMIWMVIWCLFIIDHHRFVMKAVGLFYNFFKGDSTEKKWALLSVNLLWLTWRSPRLGYCHCSLEGSVWRRPGRRAAACSPTLSHPQREASWKCTGLWGPAPVAAHMKDEVKWEVYWMPGAL